MVLLSWVVNGEDNLQNKNKQTEKQIEKKFNKIEMHGGYIKYDQ